MQARMKAQTTSESNKTISVTVPNEVAGKVYKTICQLLELANIQIVNDEGEETFSVDDVIPDRSPAMALRGLRVKEGITQKELAEKIGITQTRVSEMEKGKRTISKAMARRLEDAFGMSYKLFI